MPNKWKTLYNIEKVARSDKKTKHFTDILECSINKKTIIKTIVKKAHKSFDKWYRKKVNTFSFYTNASPSVDLILCYFYYIFVKKSLKVQNFSQ